MKWRAKMRRVAIPPPVGVNLERDPLRRDELFSLATPTPSNSAAAVAPTQYDDSSSNATRDDRDRSANISASARETLRDWLAGPAGSRPASM